MPADYPHRSSRAGRSKPYTLANAERDRNLIAVKCQGCWKTAYYLPAALIALYGADRPAYDPPPFDCSRCKTDRLLRVEMRSIAQGDWGNLEVRRPGVVRKIQTWRTVRLGDL